MKLLGEVTDFDGKTVTVRVVPDGLPELHRAYIAREAERIRVGGMLWVTDEEGGLESMGLGFGE